MRQHGKARCSVPRGKHIDMLLRKAAQNEYVVGRLLAEDDAPVEVFGFHARQAARPYFALDPTVANPVQY